MAPCLRATVEATDNCLLQPGRDVAVIGFDDVPMAQYLRPPLTTLRQPIAEVGERVVKRLFRKNNHLSVILSRTQ